MGRGIEKKANVDRPKEYYLKTQKDLYKDMDGNLTKEGLKKKMKQETEQLKSNASLCVKANSLWTVSIEFPGGDDIPYQDCITS